MLILWRADVRKILALTAVLMTANAAAQVNDPKYREYFLVGQFGEVCTMCEVVVLCEKSTRALPDRDTPPASGSYTIYHLQTRTFWSQVSTIWEWFISNFRSDTLSQQGHSRPVHVYTVKDGDWSPLHLGEARLILDPGVIELGEARIDRVSRQWFDADRSEAIGFCQRLPLWESLEVIEAHAVQDSEA